jgi:rhodanese-related sulfurtransferase
MSPIRFVILIALLCLSIAPAHAGLGEAEVPEGKRTGLGLYATAADAFQAWEAAPDDVVILDVRTPEEFMFVGHPEMAIHVPMFMQTLNWNERRGGFDMAPNPQFIDTVKEILDPDGQVFVICRSGGRSAMAVDMLAEAGFKDAWTVVDGMEGDKVKDKASPDYGHRTVNGWKNSGLPWTYAIDPGQIHLPTE